MNCQNCGMSNDVNAKFCVKCGSSLGNVQPQILQQVPAETETLFQSDGVNNSVNQGVSVPTSQSADSVQSVNTATVMTPNVSEPVVNTVPLQQGSSVSTNVNAEVTAIPFGQYFFIMLAVILKPFTTFKEELKKFSSFKNSAIITALVSGLVAIIRLVVSMISAVVVKNYDWSSASYKTTFVWDNLKNISYFKILGRSFLIFLGIIIVVAAVYYIASLIAKKQTSFSRLLGVSALSMVPVVVCSLVLSPILSLIWDKLTVPVILIGVVYTLIILYEGMNSEVSLDGDAKYYLNLICFSILGIALYYLVAKLVVSSISTGFSDAMNLF